MSDAKIKICGLTRLEDIEAANALLPDYIGFVFWERSKRNVTKEQAKELKSRLDSRIKAVGVFVDAEIDFIADLVSCGIIDVAQLHGSEDEDYISQLRKRIGGAEIIKAFNINKIESFDEAEKSSADHIMIDSGKGSGITFDWSKLERLNRPYFLAGGLGAENISEVLESVKPFAVDVSSGVETDGFKDRAKMKRFVESVRS
jgi:phosphoribosylanthranilate isomerase